MGKHGEERRGRCGELDLAFQGWNMVSQVCHVLGVAQEKGASWDVFASRAACDAAAHETANGGGGDVCDSTHERGRRNKLLFGSAVVWW